MRYLVRPTLPQKASCSPFICLSGYMAPARLPARACTPAPSRGLHCA